ncbi:glycosyl hydrolase 115 family protein [Gilvimarinus sp. SDUM040013]|uniref:Glycosyl hydrolase 115 family protein n=1 Tax=Gilvimarinus gilvus TaxID=3058038 RepID=A0ABU4RX17_9GAMM|nr:glycosyl hydrolase 115 family protein [Gilvimarinus sp. SDUM040013]MDO3386677.1 glycosyl hydrolase 115 family protein [Gilvimarinus sp. SDUM040013]MDX6849436.1 glycosyl hydrolase 115 family protein [Gilvimarinus sp. SDUM040013]
MIASVSNLLGRLRRRLLFLSLLCPLFAQAAIQPLASEISKKSPLNAFALVAGKHAAPLVVSEDAPTVIKIAVRDFADDVERVTGVRPDVRKRPPNNAPYVQVEIAPELEGRWEAFRLSADSKVLSVEGADPRGVAYGVYELSRRIGVSPWYWWADVPVEQREQLYLSAGTEPIDAPAVQYRGIFINDECWGLEAWAEKTFEAIVAEQPGVNKEVGTLGPKTYERIFELMLRLRANAIWPGMHPCTTPFHQVEGNSALADDYAIVVGSSHAEPMLRNNVGEWDLPKDQYNFLTHRDTVMNYWEQRVKERRSGESLWTLGMRGIHDSGIIGPKSQQERIGVLEDLFDAQRNLLAKHLGDGDPTRAAQIFVPYKEVLKDYNAGLKVPEDVIIVWPDDNFGYMRRYATPAERERPGGLGVYYHLSYLGSPLSWLWFDSQSVSLVWSEMVRTYEQGARSFWMGNVGDLKAHELSTEFFLDLAWNANRTDSDAPMQFLHDMAARDFGSEHAEAIAALWKRHQHLAFARKPEHLQWHLSLQPYKPTELTDAEIKHRLAAYQSLVADTAKVASALPAAAQDAFFQLVEYPVRAAAAANERYFLVELARRQNARGAPAAPATFAAAGQATQRIEALTERYNQEIAGGKWQHILTTGGVSPNDWLRFQPEPIPPLGSQEAVVRKSLTTETGASDFAVHNAPSDAGTGDFFESEGVVSINAGHFTDREDSGKGGWRSVEGLGRTGSAVTILPSTLKFDAGDAPRLSYRFYVASGGQAHVHVRLLPTHPIVPGNGLRLALALDDGKPQPVTVTEGFDTYSSEWKERVLANATEATVKLPQNLEPGWHTLHLVAVDAGVVVDKIVMDFGGLEPSYNGPPETRVQKADTKKVEPVSYRFDFGSVNVAEGDTGIGSDTRYSPDRGYGWVGDNTPECDTGDACVADKPFTLAVDVPEGNYKVTVILGSGETSAETTVKAEARRLLLRGVATAGGERKQASFTVNRRSPLLEGDGVVALNSRETGPPMVAHWDKHLTLEFLGNPAAVTALTIEPAPKTTTVFIAGDSTVTDQRNEPWAGWGQLLPAFFNSDVAIANHAESGRALFSFEAEHRLEKVLGAMKHGDYLFIQFGHNDQKDKSEGAGPFTTYQQDLREYISAVRAKGGIPVLVTPMERRRWHNDKPRETLTDYAEAVRQIGQEQGVPVIDLHRMSLEFYAALGQEDSKEAFVHYPANTFPGQSKALKDDTHHSAYGADQLARAVVSGIRENIPALVVHLRDEVPPFDAARPDSPEAVAIPKRPMFKIQTPEGN